MKQRFVNNFSTTVAATFGAGDGFLQLTSAAGLPSLGVDEYIKLTVYKQNGVSETNHEVIKITGVVGNQATVSQRGMEGGTPTDFIAGDRIQCRVTALSLEDMVDVDELTAALANRVTQSVLDAALLLKADTSAVYLKTQTYTQAEVNAAITVAINTLINGAPGALDTLIELAAAMGNDPNFATTITNQLAAKVNTADLNKALIGLGNVDNTSDANKPVSIAQQAALDLKFDKVGGNISGITTVTEAGSGTGQGIVSRAANAGGTAGFAWATNGTNRWVMDTSGTADSEVLRIRKLGTGANTPVTIGVAGLGLGATPSFQLDAVSPYTGTAVANNVIASFASAASGRDACIRLSDGANPSKYIGFLGGALYFSTSTTEFARFSSSGRLLLNKTTDDGSNQLQVSGAVNATGNISSNTEFRRTASAVTAGYLANQLDGSSNGNGVYWTGGTNLLQLVTAASAALSINSAQRVMIGTTTDDGVNKLQVNGGAKITGALAATGNITTTAAGVSSNFYIQAGSATSGQGGQFRSVDDTGTVRWVAGIPGSAAAKDYFIYDNVNAIRTLSVNYTNGDVSFGAAAGSTGEGFRVVRSASAVNFLTVTGGATGAAPVLGASGSDTDVDLILTPKNAGAVVSNITVNAAQDVLKLRNSSTGTAASMSIALGNNGSALAGRITYYGGNHATLAAYMDINNRNNAPVRVLSNDTEIARFVSTGLAVTGIATVTEAGTGSSTGGVIAATATAGGNAAHGWATGGANRWVMDTSGTADAESLRIRKLGTGAATIATISTTGLGLGRAPGYQLDVLTALTGTTVGTNTVANLESGASGRDANIRLGDGVNAVKRVGYLAGALYFATSTTENARFSPGGRLLLGTTTDNGTDQLQVTGSAYVSSIMYSGSGFRRNAAASSAGYMVNQLDGSSNGNGLYWSGAGAQVQVITAGAPALSVSSAGRVSIGTTTDDGSNKLQVTGNVAITGTSAVTTSTSTPSSINRTGSNGVYQRFSDASGNNVFVGGNNGVFEVQTPASSYSTKFTVSDTGTAITGTLTTTSNAAVGGTTVTQASLLVKETPALAGTNQYGVDATITGTSAATSIISAFTGEARTAAASYTCANRIQFYSAPPSKGAGSTITSDVNFYASDTSQGTNNIGLQSNLNAGANKWNIYATGSAINHFNGAVLIGSTTDNGTDKLQITGSAKVTGAFNATGNTTIGGTLDVTGQATLAGDNLRITTAKTPASATAAGTAGQICWDASYLYVCTATNTWKRAALTTW